LEEVKKPVLAEAAYSKGSSFFDNLKASGGGLRRGEERK
jgi:hypothetical protein